MTLTVTQIKDAKPKEKPYKLADEHGLYLMVTPTGSKFCQLFVELKTGVQLKQHIEFPKSADKCFVMLLQQAEQNAIPQLI